MIDSLTTETEPLSGEEIREPYATAGIDVTPLGTAPGQIGFRIGLRFENLDPTVTALEALDSVLGSLQPPGIRIVELDAVFGYRP